MFKRFRRISRRAATMSLFVFSVMGLLMMAGCPVVNAPPVADAGPDQAVNGSAAVTLDGSASADPEGVALTYTWTQTAGTSVTLTGATTASPTFTAPATSGTLTFQLIVNDGTEDSTADTVDITVSVPTNQPPVADAGPDQNVNGGASVTLDGSGSSDADGDPLTYAWTQTAGTSVTLTGATTASPTFTAPNTSGTLTFQLIVNDGTVDSTPDTVDISVTANPVLFIANFSGNNVTSYANPASVNGNIAPDTNLQGLQTQLGFPTDIVVDAGGALLVSNVGPPNAILAYDDAVNTNGNLAPDRNVSGATTQLAAPTTLAVNTTSDLLFVANVAGADDILVYDGASTSSFNGNVAPIRVISSASLANPYGINFGGTDTLYVANNTANNLLVFPNASTLNGTVAPTRTLTSPAFVNLFDVFVDSSDNLFVVNFGGTVLMFNNASSLNGAVTPDFTLAVPVVGATLTAIAVDSQDTGYIVDNANSAVYSYDNISTRNGTLPPDRTIAGSTTQLAGPIRVFLLE